MISYTKIPTGPYFGFTKAELLIELDRYKAEVKRGGSDLAAAAQNGQSYSFGPRRDWNLAEWQVNLQAALAYFSEAEEPPAPQTAISFLGAADL